LTRLERGATRCSSTQSPSSAPSSANSPAREGQGGVAVARVGWQQPPRLQRHAHARQPRSAGVRLRQGWAWGPEGSRRTLGLQRPRSLVRQRGLPLLVAGAAVQGSAQIHGARGYAHELFSHRGCTGQAAAGGGSGDANTDALYSTTPHAGAPVGCGSLYLAAPAGLCECTPR
jgi:hypothetical protein